jgi:Ca2+-binding RTX toxin-like protein
MSESILLDANAPVGIQNPTDMRQFNISDYGAPMTASIIDSDVSTILPVAGIGNITYYDRIDLRPGPDSATFPVFFGSNAAVTGDVLTAGAFYGFAWHTIDGFIDGISGFLVGAADIAAAMATTDRADDLALLRQMLSPDNTVTLRNVDGATSGPGHYFFAGAGADTVIGSSRGDTLLGDAGADRIEGRAGNDLLRGGTGADRLIGNRGADRLYGDNGADHLQGYTENDRLFGGRGVDSLQGGGGNDTLFGGTFADRLEGGAGNDRLFGGAGADVLVGGRGDDSLDGGLGADVFIYRPAISGHDTIAGFQDGIDTIHIEVPGGTAVDFQLAARANGTEVIFGDVSILLLGMTQSQITAADISLISL